MSEITKQDDIKIAENQKDLEKIRYSYFLNDISEQTKSEYINNEIVIHSPAKLKHIDANISLTIMLRLHVQRNKLGYLATEKALVKMKQAGNHYEPDVCFFDAKKSKKFNPDTFHFPPPNLAIEILSKTSIHRDRKQKYKDYADHDVEEYWIVDSDKKEVEQYYLEETGKYILVKIFDEEETIKSSSVKGFEIPVSAIFYHRVLDDFLFGKYKSGLEDLTSKLEQKALELKQKTSELEKKSSELEQKEEIIINNAKVMLKMGISVEQVHETTKLSVELLNKLL